MIEKTLYPHGCTHAEVIQVIVTKSTRGSGMREQPVREVLQYWSLDGKLLAESDPYLPDI